MEVGLQSEVHNVAIDFGQDVQKSKLPSGEILNLLLVIFPLSWYFFAFTIFSIFLFLLQENKAQI